MDIRKLAIVTIIAAVAPSLPMPADARTDVSVVIAPPAPIVEPVPPPRDGYVWGAGYWNWNGHRYVWERGHWMRHSPRHHWVAHNWEHRGDHWYFREGHWDRD